MFTRTERLFLRPAWPEDAGALAAAIAHEPVARMLTRVPWPYTIDDARAFVAAPADAKLPRLLITLPERGGAVIGGCGLHDVDGAAAVGYWITPDHWGRGYASEALGALAELARACGHRRLLAHHAADNPASGRVLRKVGFRANGASRTFHSMARGQAVTGPEYALQLGQCADVPAKPRFGWPGRRSYAAGILAAA